MPQTVHNYSKKYSFLTVDPEQGGSCNQASILYNRSDYIKIWKGKESVFYQLYNNINQKSVGYIYFHIKDRQARNPVHAPFGSIELMEDVGIMVLTDFIGFCLNNLKIRGIRKIIIRHYPAYYNQDSSETIISALIFNGFSIHSIDINQTVKITEQPFADIIHPMEKRKLQKCLKASFGFRHYKDDEALKLFDVIKQFRSRRNIPVNIQKNDLKILIDNFPDHYLFFSVNHGSKIIAATITVCASGNILYNFLPASDPSYSPYSPMVYLLFNLYSFCREHNFNFLDLGISSIENQPQTGLITFKERLGGKPYSILSLELDI